MDRIWLITGATSGFGRSLTLAAAIRGDIVVATGRRLDQLADLVRRFPDQIEPTRLDVTDPDQVRSVVADVLDRYGRLDVIVNSAGQGHVGAAEETSETELRDQLEVHLFGAVRVTQAVLPHLRRQRSGTIVQFSSIGGQTTFAGFSAYSASKFALEGYSEALAAEVRPFGVRVMLVEPGSFRTGLFAATTSSPRLPFYDETVGPTRRMILDEDDEHAGDPDLAAAAVLTALDSDQPPLRLVLGEDALVTMTDMLALRRAELDAWSSVSASTTPGAHSRAIGPPR